MSAFCVATLGRRPTTRAQARDGPDLAGVRFRPGAEEEAGVSDRFRRILIALAVMVAVWSMLVGLAARLPGRRVAGAGRVPGRLRHLGPPTPCRPTSALADKAAAVLAGRAAAAGAAGRGPKR